MACPRSESCFVCLFVSCGQVRDREQGSCIQCAHWNWSESAIVSQPSVKRGLKRISRGQGGFSALLSSSPLLMTTSISRIKLQNLYRLPFFPSSSWRKMWSTWPLFAVTVCEWLGVQTARHISDNCASALKSLLPQGKHRLQGKPFNFKSEIISTADHLHWCIFRGVSVCVNVKNPTAL